MSTWRYSSGRFGQVGHPRGGPVRRAAEPFNVSNVRNDFVARELNRLGLDISLPDADPAGVNLTRAPRQALQQARGRAARQAIERVMRGRPMRVRQLRRKGLLQHAIERARRG
jgi:hypothetical protein